MPTHTDMTHNTPQTPHPGGAEVVPGPNAAQSAPAASPATDPGAQISEAGVLDALQHQVAIFARRAEQTRLGGVGQARNSMDRAAYLLLNRLAEDGPMGVKALAASMGIDSSTVTRQVAPLVDSGMVKRTSHPEDGRAVLLQLSPRGATRLAQVQSSRRELMSLVTEDWSAEERDTFCELLTRFNRTLRGVHPATAGAEVLADGTPHGDAAGEATP